MTKRFISRLTSKGQATIPAEVRRALKLAAGDWVAFQLAEDEVTLRKANVLDRVFLKLAEGAFEEWSSPEDEAAFAGL